MKLQLHFIVWIQKQGFQTSDLITHIFIFLHPLLFHNDSVKIVDFFYYKPIFEPVSIKLPKSVFLKRLASKQDLNKIISSSGGIHLQLVKRKFCSNRRSCVMRNRPFMKVCLNYIFAQCGGGGAALTSIHYKYLFWSGVTNHDHISPTKSYS